VSAEARDNYETGYGKPPIHTRFKPGQSGNPRGRPRRRSSSMSRKVDEELNGFILVRQDGRSKKIRTKRAVVLQLFRKAFQGNVRAMEWLLSEILDLEPSIEKHRLVVLTHDEPMPEL
jgi:hypothetical protein